MAYAGRPRGDRRIPTLLRIRPEIRQAAFDYTTKHGFSISDLANVAVGDFLRANNVMVDQSEQEKRCRDIAAGSST